MITTWFSKGYLAGILLAIAAFFPMSQSHAQITLAFQGGELGDTWNYTGSGASALALTEAALAPNKTTGTQSLVCGGDTGGGNCFGSGPGPGNGPDVARTFTFAPVNLSGSNQFTHSLTFNWGNRSPACMGTGWDAGEDLIFTPFHNGIAQVPIIIAAGNENAPFDIHTHSFAYSIPTCVVDFSFSVSVTTNRADELLFIDDVRLTAPQMNVTLAQPGTITGPILMCVGTGSMCNYSVPDVPGTTYLWYNLSGGAIFNLPNGDSHMSVNWAPVPAGIYTLMVAAVDACGNTGPPQQIQVLIGTVSPPTISGPASMCNGETVTLTSSQSTYIEWSTGATTASINVNSPGTYSLEFLSGCGTTQTISYTISLTAGPQVTTTVTPVSCNGLSDGAIQVNSSSSNLQYTLNGGAPQSSNLFTGLSAGNYTVGVASSTGCSGQAAAIVTQPAPMAVTAATSGFLCEGETIQLNGSTNMSGTAIYFWSGPNGFTSNNQNPNGMLESGTYHLDVMVNGCTGSTDLTFVVSPPPVVEFTSTEVCKGNATEFSSAGSSATAPDEIALYEWSFGDGQTGIAPYMNHIYLNAGVYTATLEITTQNGCTASLTRDVGVNEVPYADFSYLPHEIAISNPTVQFTNLSTLASTYSWDFDYNDETSTEFSPGFVYPQADGTYEVLLVATAANGCVDSIRKAITIGNGLVYYIPNAFTPNGDGINDIFLPVFTSGIDESAYTFTLFNRWGELVFESTDVYSGWDGKVNNEMIQEGTYVWSIRFKYKENADREQISGHVVLLK